MAKETVTVVMERIPKGLWTVGALVALTCGILLWQGLSLLSPPALIPPAGMPAGTSHTSDANSSGEDEGTPSATQMDTPQAQSNEIVVHVAGAVKNPGIVRIPRGSRVDDAVRAAGGFSNQADPDLINLAQPLEDGVQVYVPRKGESVTVEGRVGSVSPSGVTVRGSAGRQEPPAGKINLNTASAEQLESLPGVGPATARAIIEYRKQNGGFQSVDELIEVRGIGPKKLEQIRPYVVVR
ncbi:MAG: helix-hairpin-helix domain-containing protein [Firmicutes bacterium]|nr:helix-hairpin-helix domain-containing protein [Bacillota bacterium]